MAELIFVGRSDDNTHLVLSDPDGNEFSVPIDDYLIRSLRSAGSAAPGGALGISPRDIQARIRRGEDSASIAAEAGVPVERIERYAGPVYTERWHMSQRARDAHVRRGEANLGDAVSTVLGTLGVDVLTVEWDSHRRDDARWNVTVQWPSGDGSGVATWIYDPAGQTLVPLDDEAKWLVDESLAPGSHTPPIAESRPRLVAVPDALHEDTPIEISPIATIGTVMPEPAPYESTGLDELEPPAWAGPGHPTMPVSLDDDPSWDDILFGSRPSDT